MPYISIIVPVYNSRNSIEKCLKAIRQSTYKDYELIVIDDGSSDGTSLIAGNYADNVIRHGRNLGSGCARNSGVNAANGKIIVNIDSDVIIGDDALDKINDYFIKNEEVDALTGMLSQEHPHPNFFSQYKNLYMNYIFGRLPERVTFLYGSICAIRRQAIRPWSAVIKYGVDTALGQELISCGRQIAFLKDLKVVHLKKYNLFSFLKNDFSISFHWAKIFIQHRGWKQLGRNSVGFAHSPKEQLFSIIIAFIIILEIIAPAGRLRILPLAPLILLWVFINLAFFRFLARSKGLLFAAAGIFINFIDNIIMGSGIISGSISSFMTNTGR